MIFYFSGTGNSYYVAKQMLEPGERLVDMAEALRNKDFMYIVEKGEKLGFVFPVYFFSLPTVVEEFVTKLHMKNDSYTYAIITAGGNMGGCGKKLHHKLWKLGVKLAYVREVIMPDNAMLFYQIQNAEEATKRLEAAEPVLAEIKADLADRKVLSSKKGNGKKDVMEKTYAFCTGTKKFRVEPELCIHCGLCEKNCPTDTIMMVEGLPTWVNAHCTKCTACINRCPKEAIQYGRGTKKRNRYVHPIFGGKTQEE